jgi:5'-deoxynucleotidase YfbR-like HD superfamily hydrolase
MVSTRKPRRAWQRMLSGRRLDLLDPSALDVEIEDIAHGLARVARWNGQTEGDHPFSVAQHSVLVEDIVTRIKPLAPQSLKLAALLHDAAEYVVGDLISPFKVAVGLDYRELEKSLMRAIHQRFGLAIRLPTTASKLIKRADGIAAYYEATQLAGFSQRDGLKFFGRPSRRIGDLDLTPWPTKTAKARFLKLFADLSPK